jgi:hypothetical protein
MMDGWRPMAVKGLDRPARDFELVAVKVGVEVRQAFFKKSSFALG